MERDSTSHIDDYGSGLNTAAFSVFPALQREQACVVLLLPGGYCVGGGVATMETAPVHYPILAILFFMLLLKSILLFKSD